MSANLASRPTHSSGLAALTLAAIGIVYGDIGTSPLYTLKTVFSPEHGLALTPANLLGVVSLIFWGHDHRHHAQVRGTDHARRQPR